MVNTRSHPAHRRLRLERLTRRVCEGCGSVAEAPANVVPLRCPVCGGMMRVAQSSPAWGPDHEA